MTSSLDGIRVLDLSRVLAGPVCTQILGDLGADIIKVERPLEGDDTRYWGPPFLKNAAGHDTTESAYYLSANRNKRSIAIDISTPEGQEIIHMLAAKCDILIHNFKVGSLDKFGLGYEAMHGRHPHLIYTAISGFGQNGPLSREPGYDLLAQAMGGLMAHTGKEGEDPMKAGVALSDIMTGLYAAIGTLAALNARQQSGKGQLVDVALLDSTLASMTNIAQFFLTSGATPKRFGNSHSTIVPYQAFAASDGHIVIAIGNDHQFGRLCAAIDRIEWASDPHYSHNSARVAHRDELIPMIEDILKQRTVQQWVDQFREIDIPCAPVNSIDQTFAMDQIQTREMDITMDHPFSADKIHLVGSPLKLSENPASYRRPPPTLGQHTDEILKNILNLSKDQIEKLKAKNIV